MDLHDLTAVLSAEGPFVTVHVTSESAVEQAADKYELQWRDVVTKLADLGVDAATREAVAAARGGHAEGASRFVVATTADATVHLAVSLSSEPRREMVDLAPLPHLLPLVDDLSSSVRHVVVLADRTGADVSAYYDVDRVAHEVTVKGHAPDIRKVPVGGWSHLRYQHRAENGWVANAHEIIDAVIALVDSIGAEVIIAAGDERELTYVRQYLPQRLQGSYLEVQGGRGADGSDALVRQRVADALARRTAIQVIDLLETYAQERGQAKRAVDGVEDVVEALRKAQVETLLVTTDAADYSTLWFGPEPMQLATREQDLRDLGVDAPQEGSMVDVLVRAALGSAAGVQVVPDEMPTAPNGGVGALLRYADSIGSTAASQT